MRIAISTGGGDAPGLNAVIRAIVLSALRQGWEVFGIKRGYQGLLQPGSDLEELCASPEGIVRLDINAASRDRRFEQGGSQADVLGLGELLGQSLPRSTPESLERDDSFGQR